MSQRSRSPMSSNALLSCGVALSSISVVAKREYDAFISYAREDTAIALRLQRRLEGLSHLGKQRERPLRVFVDTEELSAAPSLGEVLQDALASSQFLVVIATPASVHSRWVHKEVEMWLGLQRRSRLLFVVAEGEPEVLLNALVGDVEEEKLPLAVDVRARTLRQTLRRLDDEFLRVGAPLLGVAYDELRQRAIRQRLRRQRQVIAALACTVAIVASAATVAIWQWREAVEQRAIADRRTREAIEQKKLASHRLQQAIEVSRNVIATVDQELRGIAGAENLRLALVGEAAAMLDTLADRQSEGTELFRTRFEAHLRRGLLAAGFLDFEVAVESLDAAEALLPRLPTELGRLRSGISLTRARGELEMSRKKYADALPYFDQAAAIGQQLASASEERSASIERGLVLRLRGDAHAMLRDWDTAALDYESAEALYAEALEQLDDVDARVGASAVQERLSRVAEVRRDASEVVRCMRAAVELVDSIESSDSTPESTIRLVELYERLSDLSMRWDRQHLAEGFDRKALDKVWALYMTSPQNARYRRGLARVWSRLSTSARERGDLGRAQTLAALNTYMLEMLAKEPGAGVALRVEEVEARAELIDVLIQREDLGHARTQYNELKAVVETLSTLPTGGEGMLEPELIYAYNLAAEAARQLEQTEDRERWFLAALERSKARFESNPGNGDAQLDLLVAHANMILAAAAREDFHSMQEHAHYAQLLLPTDLAITGSEQEMVEQVREMITQVLG